MNKLWTLCFALGMVLVVSSLSMCGGSGTKNSGTDMAMSGSTDMAMTGSSTDMAKAASGFTCSQGTLYAGDPVYTGDVNARPTSGTAIKTDPPLVWQTLVFSGVHLYTRQESEIWHVDTSAASPVETKITGTTPAGSTYNFNAGTCAAASFSQLRGLAALPDGSLVASDYFADAIVKITNPNDSGTCAVAVLAGTAGPLTGLDPSDNTTLPTGGNMDGTGSAASFNAPTAMTADSAGNIWVIDKKVADGSTLVRKITSAGAVTTVATLGTATGAPTDITNLTTIGTNLYAASRDAVNDSYVIQINTSTGALTTILGGDSSMFPPVDQGTDPAVTGITTDGTNLIVAGDGYVWYLTLAGQLTLLAGTGNSIDFFPMGYDPTMAHSAATLALPTAIGSADEDGTGSFNHIVYHSGAVYYRGFADGSSAFIEKISCP